MSDTRPTFEQVKEQLERNKRQLKRNKFWMGRWNPFRYELVVEDENLRKQDARLRHIVKEHRGWTFDDL